MDGGPVRAQTGQRAARHHDHRVLRDILAVCPAAVVPVARALHIRMPMQSSGVRDDIASASVRLSSYFLPRHTDSCPSASVLGLASTGSTLLHSDSYFTQDIYFILDLFIYINFTTLIYSSVSI